MMRNLYIWILLSVMATANIQVVTSNNQQLSISKEEISNLFLGKTDQIQGIRLTPIDNINRACFEKFYRKVVNKSPEQLHAYWVNQIFSSNKKPPQKLSDSEITKRLLNHAQIISYSVGSLPGQIVLTVR